MALVLESVLETVIGDNGAAIWTDTATPQALPAPSVAAAVVVAAGVDWPFVARVFVATVLALWATRLVVRTWRRRRAAAVE